METYTTGHQLYLSDLLTKRGIEHIREYQDGHKRVDIGVPKAKLFIEIDGLHHYTDPEQIKRDFKRDHYSDGDDFATLRIPNELILLHGEAIADAVATVVKERMIQFAK